MEAGLPPWRQKALPGEPTQQDRLPLHRPAPMANPSPVSPSRCLWELQIKIKRVPTDVPPHPCHRQLRPQPEEGLSLYPEQGPQGAWELFGKKGGFQIGILTCAADFASNLLCDSGKSQSLSGPPLPIPENRRSSWVSQNEPEKGGWTVSDLCITSHSSTIPGIQEGSGHKSVAR